MFGFLKSRKFWHYLTFGLVVVSSRSAKVRRVAGKIENWLDLIHGIEQMAEAEGGGRLPFAKIRDQYQLSEEEARELVQRFYEYSRMAVVITDVPSELGAEIA